MCVYVVWSCNKGLHHSYNSLPVLINPTIDVLASLFDFHVVQSVYLKGYVDLRVSTRPYSKHLDIRRKALVVRCKADWLSLPVPIKARSFLLSNQTRTESESVNATRDPELLMSVMFYYTKISRIQSCLHWIIKKKH